MTSLISSFNFFNQNIVVGFSHMESTLEAIKYRQGSLQLLNQLLLPHVEQYEEIGSVEEIYRAIKEMRVRGAPAIGVSAGLGVAVSATKAAQRGEFKTAEQARAFITQGLDYVGQSRPTAVNLINVVNTLKEALQKMFDPNLSVQQLVAHFEEAAAEQFHHDIRCNEQLMRHGATHFEHTIGEKKKGSDHLRILTICNSGSLATSKYGTALGVIRQVHMDGKLAQVYSLETRPWNQGSRLTVYECVHDHLPVTLLVDSAAASLMRKGNVDVVVVGADRICRNGDTANKIGTYNIAVAAKFHNIPFFVAAPTSTFDLGKADGGLIVIEERDPSEITHNMQTKARVAADGPTLSVWNPVFDVTPAELITGGIITEMGVFTPKPHAPYFDLSQPRQ